MQTLKHDLTRRVVYYPETTLGVDRSVVAAKVIDSERLSGLPDTSAAFAK